MHSLYFLIFTLLAFQLNSNMVWSQRDFANPAAIDPAPCSCDIRIGTCDPDCCCDPDCTDADLRVSSVCNSVRTTASYASLSQLNFQTWNCSNSTSAAMFDYFPFVCFQFELNGIMGEYYSTRNVSFINAKSTVSYIRSLFVNENSDLFQKTSITPTLPTNYSIGAPVKISSTTEFTFSGNLAGMVCQNNVPVLFGVNRDVTCKTDSSSSLCSAIRVASLLKGADTSTLVTVQFFEKTATASTETSRDLTSEYYFANSTFNINNFPSTNLTIYDYCPGRYPVGRTQRFDSVCNFSDISLCANNQYQTWTGCAVRDNFQYNTINDTFFVNRASSKDDSSNFADFDNSVSVTSTSLACSSASSVQRVFYRFNYSSLDNTISTVEVYVLYRASSTTSSNVRITFEWNDAAPKLALATTIPRGYASGQVLQFKRNNNASDVSIPIPNSNGLCYDATLRTVHYQKSVSSICYVQLKQSTIQQCHDLKLNMYLYFNTLLAPATSVMAYPSLNATEIKLRDDYQDNIDLTRIDESRGSNRLDASYIVRTALKYNVSTIYDTRKTLSLCFDVPTGIYIEFGYVRLQISSTVWFERIVSVQYNYSYSNWQFDCSTQSCDSSSTQRYPISFQVAWFDYTSSALNLTGTTKSDIISADNYIQHLLWLITPEYNGESGYRNYTIAMILIFIAISVVVMHIQLFGVMCPF